MRRGLRIINFIGVGFDSDQSFQRFRFFRDGISELDSDGFFVTQVERVFRRGIAFRFDVSVRTCKVRHSIAV
ncbi:hypothetical protein [Rhizobium fabae]|uniref:Uncharacterized protein n=1 Tax=Rhizobium fabae TaxID=573179 RepID=A0A7W6FM51_9HYPH|nr:hypothetical protein [Rhizobium fabae]MBB3918186.1 hypothetical protein [Rhizobium fabae]